VKTKIILCLALILGGISFGCSTAPRLSADPIKSRRDAEAKQFFDDYLMHCETNAINCLWFLQNNPRIGMKMTIHLDQATVTTERDVYNWATQYEGTRQLTYSQGLTLKQIISHLPRSDEKADRNTSVFISMRNGNNVDLFQCDRRHVPCNIQRIYDIAGGYFETNTDTQ
jgi:hypothetical protein